MIERLKWKVKSLVTGYFLSFAPALLRLSNQNIKKKVLYLSVRVFSTAVLIVDTVNKKTNIKKGTEIC